MGHTVYLITQPALDLNELGGFASFLIVTFRKFESIKHSKLFKSFVGLKLSHLPFVVIRYLPIESIACTYGFTLITFKECTLMSRMLNIGTNSTW